MIVGLIIITFILEVVNALDYIQGTRLALINYNKGVAALLIIMCLTRLFGIPYILIVSSVIVSLCLLIDFSTQKSHNKMLLYFSWNFFIHQWVDRVEHFQLEMTVVTEADQEVRGLTMILTILIHDLIFKLLKIFFFSRYKPAGLAFTIPQLLQPVIDLLVVGLRKFVDMIDFILFRDI